MLKSTPASTVTSPSFCGTAAFDPDVRKNTELENQMMDIKFKVFKLWQPPDRFVEKHYLNIKNIVQKLSVGKRSVKIVNDLLKAIFCTSDAQNESENPER